MSCHLLGGGRLEATVHPEAEEAILQGREILLHLVTKVESEKVRTENSYPGLVTMFGNMPVEDVRVGFRLATASPFTDQGQLLLFEQLPLFLQPKLEVESAFSI